MKKVSKLKLLVPFLVVNCNFVQFFLPRKYYYSNVNTTFQVVFSTCVGGATLQLDQDRMHVAQDQNQPGLPDDGVTFLGRVRQ
jgi:hypothetical protein